MTNHQKVTSILGNAGLVAQRYPRRTRQPGYQVAKLGHEVGVICGPYDISIVCVALMQAGLAPYQKNNAAHDAVFVA